MTKTKQKIRQSIARRFKVTKNGKVLHRSSFSRHLRSKKNKSQLRRYQIPKQLRPRLAKKIKRILGEKTA
jgi:large subunit ribosomal protein L35